MANNYPYISSGGPVVKLIAQLRKSFPPTIDADIIRKLGLAPKNESYLINIIRFLRLIDEEGKKVEEAAKAFSVHDDPGFQKELSAIVRKAYKELFDLRGEETWKLSVGELITFFRQADGSSAVVGQRQAVTFQTLAALCGHADIPKVREGGAPKARTAVPVNSGGQKSKMTRKAGSAESASRGVGSGLTNSESRIGLTVRIEINLPANGSQEVYDSIFQSIRRNLIDGK